MRKSLMRWIMITITIVVIMCITNINKTLYTVQAKTSGEEASLGSVNIRNITLGSTIYGGLTGDEDYEDVVYKFTTPTSGKLNNNNNGFCWITIYDTRFRWRGDVTI